MPRSNWRVSAAIALLVWSLPARAAEEALSELVIVTASGERLAYSVEVADTPEERRLGLMHRLKLPPDRGMLLWYGKPMEVAVWMKNTYVALDILFIDADGRVTRIAQAEPLSEELIPSDGPVYAVLELNAGQSAARGIAPGAWVAFLPDWPGP